MNEGHHGHRAAAGRADDGCVAQVAQGPDDDSFIHSDQGSQFGSDDFNRRCKDNALLPSMNRRGNCWDNAVAESFFSSLKKERIKRCIYASRQNTKSDLFDYIEVFYNRVRRYSHLDQLSPLVFEQL